MTYESSHALRTVGDALNDPTTALGRAAAQCSADSAKRLAAARKIIEAEGLSLEDALARVWQAVTFVVPGRAS